MARRSRSARADHKGRPYDWGLVVFCGRDGVVVCVFGWWLFWVSRLGGHTPLAALAPLSLRERGKALPTLPSISGFLLSPESREVGQWSAKRECQV